MCGRREVDRERPELANWGDMNFGLIRKIAQQLPEGIFVQFHNNGEPLLYPLFGDAVALFSKQIKCVDTNGKLLVEKADEIIDNLDTITISTFEGDTEADEQWSILQEFMKIKGDRKPLVILRELGNLQHPLWQGLKAHRQFHSPKGSFDYQHQTTVPEIGVCLEALHHLSIDRFGFVSMCVRFDPQREGIIGDANHQTLEDIWNGIPRKVALEQHLKGNRKCVPLCRSCDYWGCPSG